MDFDVVDKGLWSYEQAYAHQKAEVERLGRGEGRSTLYLLEHPPVYTYGRKSAHVESLPGQSVVEVERGGESTYHNPGQLVGYPIFRLEGEQRDVHRFLRNLEEALIRTLAEYSILAARREGATGVWVDGGRKKIASIGVAVSRWVTYHGFALNVANELSGFHRITPCGFSAGVMTSMQEVLGCPVDIQAVKASVAHQIKQVFYESASRAPGEDTHSEAVR